MIRISHPSEVLILGRGATEAAAWALARRLSTERRRAVTVYHPHDGDYHAVTASMGREMGHRYRVGGEYWTATTTIREAAARAR